MDQTEYGILMLKPDAVELGVESEVHERLAERELDLIGTRTWHMTKEEAIAHCLHPVGEYIDYLTSGPVKFLLVSGIRPADELRTLKGCIRRQYGLGRGMRNLIHTADDGTEYYRLLRVAFPEVDPSSYANRVDQAMPFDPDDLSRLDRVGRVRYGVICIPPAMGLRAVQDLARRDWINLQYLCAAALTLIVHGCRIELACWLHPEAQADARLWRHFTRIQSVEELYGCAEETVGVYLSHWEIGEDESSEYRQIIWEHKMSGDQRGRDIRLLRLPTYALCRGLTDINLSGVVCHRPQLSLLENELRMDVCRLAKLHRGGGSAGEVPVGTFGVSLAAYDDSPMPGSVPSTYAPH